MKLKSIGLIAALLFFLIAVVLLGYIIMCLVIQSLNLYDFHSPSLLGLAGVSFAGIVLFGMILDNTTFWKKLNGEDKKASGERK